MSDIKLYKNKDLSITLYNDDCFIILDNIQCMVDLIIIDPPYYSTNIKELGDNSWKTLKEYILWFKNILNKCINILKSNGAIYIFHNDVEIMVDILYWLKHDKNMFLRNHIKWNKFPTHNNFSRVIKTFGKNRRYGQTFCEDIYFITKQGDSFNNPFNRIMKTEMKRLNLTQKDLSILCPSKNGNITGWVSNKLKGIQIPSKEQWSKLCQVFKIDDNYNILLEQYNMERYKFNQPYIDFSVCTELQKEKLKPYSEIWEYSKDKIDWFYTSKPIKMLENIIEISTNKGDTVLDCFMGSGTTAIACHNLNRNFIGIEKDESYYINSLERIESCQI